MHAERFDPTCFEHFQLPSDRLIGGLDLWLGGGFAWYKQWVSLVNGAQNQSKPVLFSFSQIGAFGQGGVSHLPSKARSSAEHLALDAVRNLNLP